MSGCGHFLDLGRCPTFRKVDQGEHWAEIAEWRILTPTQTSGAAAATALFAPRSKRGISGTMSITTLHLWRQSHEIVAILSSVRSCTGCIAIDELCRLSLPKTRSARSDGVALQGSHIARSGACRARPSPEKREFAPHYNSARISKEFAEGALRWTQSND